MDTQARLDATADAETLRLFVNGFKRNFALPRMLVNSAGSEFSAPRARASDAFRAVPGLRG